MSKLNKGDEKNKKYSTYILFSRRGKVTVEIKYKLKELREKQNMSQEELAERSGVSRSIISELETGKRLSTTTPTLIKISKALGTNIKEIFL